MAGRAAVAFPLCWRAMNDAEFADVLDSVRRFVRTEVVPREDEIEESDAIIQAIESPAHVSSQRA